MCVLSVLETYPLPPDFPLLLCCMLCKCFPVLIFQVASQSRHSLECIFFLYHHSFLYKQQIALLLPFKFREEKIPHHRCLVMGGGLFLLQTYWEVKNLQSFSLYSFRGYNPRILLLSL